MKTLTTLLLILTFISCGKNSNVIPETQKTTIYKTEPAQPEMFSYELREESCSTGEQAFESFENACMALKDHELNLDCAIEQREELFLNEECPGAFNE